MQLNGAEGAHQALSRLAADGPDWMTLIAEASEVIGGVIPFDRCCWHSVDPGTVLFSGSVNRRIECSGSWLAYHEYISDDVNQWWQLARSGRKAGAMSLATDGDLSRSARYRSQESYGVGDELRVSFTSGGTYWGAAGFLRDQDQPWFSEDDVDVLGGLADVVADAFRRAMVRTVASTEPESTDVDGPGVIVFDDSGAAEWISPAAERWISEMTEEPAPETPTQSKVVQAVAARARITSEDRDPLKLSARARVQTRSGAWLVVYGTILAGGSDRRTAVVIQPATPNEVAPLVAMAYGLSSRETEIARLCMQGRATKEMARLLHVSPYTVQDHLKSIFDKTGVRTRNELVGQIFLEHYVTRWEGADDVPAPWTAHVTRDLSLEHLGRRRSVT